MKKQCVVITGMHRSGTSLCSAALKYMGFAHGDIGDYADEENPKGYFENFEIVQLNDTVLRYLGGAWYSPGTLRDIDRTLPEIQVFMSQAISLIQKYYNDKKRFVIKDPRICLTIRFWELVFEQLKDIQVSFIVMVRNPVEVALSQQKRHLHNPAFFKLGEDLSHTQILWHAYNCSLAASSHVALLVDYRNMFDNVEREFERMVKYLRVLPENSRLEAFLQEIFSKDLYRSGDIESEGPFFDIYNRLGEKLRGDQIDLSQLQNYFSLDM